MNSNLQKKDNNVKLIDSIIESSDNLMKLLMKESVPRTIILLSLYEIIKFLTIMIGLIPEFIIMNQNSFSTKRRLTYKFRIFVKEYFYLMQNRSDNINNEMHRIWNEFKFEWENYSQLVSGEIKMNSSKLLYIN